MLWADVSWHDRFAGLDSFHRLLAIPLLLAQFRRTGNGIWVVGGFFISSIALLIASYVVAFAFGDRWHGVYGVPVHDTIFQGSVFLICAFGAVGYAALVRDKRSRSWLIALFAIGALFLINFAFVTTSRIALVIAPLLLLLLGWRLFGWKGALGALLLAVMAGSAMWVGSPVLRDRMARSIVELKKYHAADEATSIGEHIAFLKEFFADNRVGADHRSRHRLDSRGISPYHGWKNRGIGDDHSQSAQSDVCRCHSIGRSRGCGAMGDVDRTHCFIHRTERARVAWLSSGGGKCFILDRSLSLVRLQ